MNPQFDDDRLQALRDADVTANIEVTSADALAAVRRARLAPRGRRRRHLPTRRRSRAAVWVTALVAVLAVGVPAGAVATGFVARTGWFGSSPNPAGIASEAAANTESDQTEWLDLGADDLPVVVASLYPEWLPLAPGVTRDDVISSVTGELAGVEGLAQETYVLKAFEYRVYRDWISAWIAARDSGDQIGQSTAHEVLGRAADWPAMVATDGGRITDGMRAFARRIGTGDYEAAQALAQLENAHGWDGVDRAVVIASILAEAAQ